MPRSKRRKGAKKSDRHDGGKGRPLGRRYYDPGAQPRRGDPMKRAGATIAPTARPIRRAHT